MTRCPRVVTLRGPTERCQDVSFVMAPSSCAVVLLGTQHVIAAMHPQGRDVDQHYLVGDGDRNRPHPAPEYAVSKAALARPIPEAVPEERVPKAAKL